VQKKIADRYELFEQIMEVNKALSRETLLERLKETPNQEELESLNDANLLALYCERMVGSIEAAGFRLDRR
jgi:hypothetical protein